MDHTLTLKRGLQLLDGLITQYRGEISAECSRAIACDDAPDTVTLNAAIRITPGTRCDVVRARVSWSRRYAVDTEDETVDDSQLELELDHETAREGDGQIFESKMPETEGDAE